MVKIAVMLCGMIAAVAMLFILIWSVKYPALRLWPPDQSSHAHKTIVWIHTLLIFGSALYLGIADWNALNWPLLPRLVIGIPIILVANVVVWSGVFQLGFAATSGEATGLQTGGLYRYSRNPQYVADIALLVGWAVLSASVWALPVIMIGLIILLLAPLAEEGWLTEKYGSKYIDYRSKVRRYL